VVGGDRHFAHLVAPHEDGASLGGHLPQKDAEADDAFGVEPVRRFVEDEDGRVAEQRRRARGAGPVRPGP
jgi:hypothetical protein